MLGVSANLLTDIAHNVRLDSAPAVPVGGLYTSVLYDALDLASMNSATRRRANRWLVIISALHGALRPTDRIPPYRLSMSVNLGMLGPLASAPLTAVLPIAAGRGVILDCRSSTYTAAWALVLVFLIAITVVAEIADGAEVFDIAGHWAARAGHGRTWLLWLLIIGLSCLSTIVLSLDTTAVLLTPVVIAVVRQLQLNPLPFAMTTGWLANTASLLLPGSNLTTLLALHRFSALGLG